MKVGVFFEQLYDAEQKVDNGIRKLKEHGLYESYVHYCVGRDIEKSFEDSKKESLVER